MGTYFKYIFILLFTLSLNIKAQYTTNGGNSDFNNTAAWTGGSVPDLTFWDGSHDADVSHTVTRSTALSITSGNVLTIKSGGNLTLSSTLSLSNNGTIIVESGGTLTVNGAITVGSSSTFTINSGGTFTNNNNFSLVAGADVDLDGTNTITGTLNSTGACDFDLNGGSLDITGKVTFNSDGNITIGGDMDCGGDFDVTGSGGATISLSGTLDVTSGTLTVDNNGTINGTGVVGWGTLSANPSCSGAIITCDGTATSVDNNTGGGCGGSYADPAGTPLNLNTCGIGTLPIELLSFDAFPRGDVVDIFWATGMELNNDYFEIMGSSNGIDWEVLAIVGGAGNSNEVINYKETVSGGFNFYKLRQNDYDGAFEDSEILRMKTNTNIQPTITNSPEYIFIKGAANSQLEIYDISGRIIERSFIEENLKVINSTSFKGGVYIIRVNQYNHKISIK